MLLVAEYVLSLAAMYLANSFLFDIVKFLTKTTFSQSLYELNLSFLKIQSLN